MLTALLAGLAAALIHTSLTCNTLEQLQGVCSVANTGSAIEIGATSPGNSREDTDDRANQSSAAPAPPAAPAECAPHDSIACRGGYTVAVFRPTLSDLASFAPPPVALVDEPAGVGVAGLPVNFVVTPAVHEQAGVVLGFAVTVRFTPSEVLFIHGDGTVRSSPHGGRTWAARGLPQFSATETSHSYRSRGVYSASAAVRYTAEFSLGSGWVSVPGTLEIPTASTDIRIVEARTALVRKTCIEDPAGVGC